jgi:hypothetical protein
VPEESFDAVEIFFCVDANGVEVGWLGTHSAADLGQADWIVGSLEGLAVTVKADVLELRFSPVATV